MRNINRVYKRVYNEGLERERFKRVNSEESEEEMSELGVQGVSCRSKAKRQYK